MDVLKSLCTAVEYIETHLTEEIDYREVARRVYFSEHHFKRMFSFVAGISLADYVRNRRLTLAAFDLKRTNLRVIDVAVKYGYHSPDSFSKAFQALHGVTPSAARNTDTPLKAYPKITFRIEIKGDVGMNYRLVEKDAFTIAGKKETVEMVSENDAFNPEMWKQLEAVEAVVSPYDNTDFDGVLHVSLTNESGDIEYYIGVATTQMPPEDMVVLEVPQVTWAVFDAEGEMPEALLSTWESVYTDWFPTSGYELAEAPELVRGQNDKTEIWVPVKENS